MKFGPGAGQANPNFRHGYCIGKTAPTYHSWHAMKRRCSDPKVQKFAHYGGRGITYDPRWETFENFLEDMGPKPAGHSLERLHNNEGYSKGNCIWATRSTQMLNRRSTKFAEINGERKSYHVWAIIHGIKPSELHRRIKRGWDFQEALTTPVGVTQ
jgi:hypothetical protein